LGVLLYLRDKKLLFWGMIIERSPLVGQAKKIPKQIRHKYGGELRGSSIIYLGER